jgi:hypothetical protein
MARDVKVVIDELRKGLEEDEKEYLMAKRLIDTPSKVLEFLNSLKERMMPLMTYDADTQPPHSAVAVVASMKERLAGVFQDLQFIADYEERKKEYKVHVQAHVGLEDSLDDLGEGSTI